MKKKICEKKKRSQFLQKKTRMSDLAELEASMYEERARLERECPGVFTSDKLDDIEKNLASISEIEYEWLARDKVEVHVGGPRTHPIENEKI